MRLPGLAVEDFVVLGRGEAKQSHKELFDRQAVATVRYADPASWVVATACARALALAKDEAPAAREHIGVVVTSSHGPGETLAKVAEDARAGFASPLRYPAANPCSLAGVACILFGLQGPTMNLLMDPEDGVALGVCVAGRWLRRGAAAYMLVAACARMVPGEYLSRALLLGPRGSGTTCRSEGGDHVNWLTTLDSNALS